MNKYRIIYEIMPKEQKENAALFGVFLMDVLAPGKSAACLMLDQIVGYMMKGTGEEYSIVILDVRIIEAITQEEKALWSDGTKQNILKDFLKKC